MRAEQPKDRGACAQHRDMKVYVTPLCNEVQTRPSTRQWDSWKQIARPRTHEGTHDVLQGDQRKNGGRHPPPDLHATRGSHIQIRTRSPRDRCQMHARCSVQREGRCFGSHSTPWRRACYPQIYQRGGALV